MSVGENCDDTTECCGAFSTHACTSVAVVDFVLESSCAGFIPGFETLGEDGREEADEVCSLISWPPPSFSLLVGIDEKLGRRPCQSHLHSHVLLGLNAYVGKPLD